MIIIKPINSNSKINNNNNLFNKILEIKTVNNKKIIKNI